MEQLSDTLPLNSEMKRWESALIDNNFSLVYFRAGKFALGALKMRRALRITDQLDSELLHRNVSSSPSSASGGGGGKYRDSLRIPLSTLSAGQHYALLYNSGIQLLFAQKPAAAFSALLPVLKTYSHNPRLWLRLAECSVKVHKYVLKLLLF